MFGIESTVDLAKVWDVAVVGGGPAGITAAMYAARKNLSTILIAMDLGGQVGITHLVTNYPGMPVVEGPELVRLMFEQAYMYGLERMLGERVDAIRVDGRAKVLELASGKEVKARSVILASGAEKRKLEIPGEEEFAGRGVVYCSTCDGPFYRDKKIAIVGGGSSALEAAVEMSGIAKKVHVVSRGPWSGEEWLRDKAGAAPGVRPLTGYEPVEIRGGEIVEQLVIRDVETRKPRTLVVDGVFIEVGLLAQLRPRPGPRAHQPAGRGDRRRVGRHRRARRVRRRRRHGEQAEADRHRRRRGREGRAGGVRLPDLAALTEAPGPWAGRPPMRQAPPVCSRMKSTVRRS